MDFTFDETQQDVLDLATTILTDRGKPERLSAVEAAGDSVDEVVWQDLAAAGLIGIALPEELGGSGAGFTELCVLVQAAARACVRVPLVDTAVAVAAPLARFGTPEQRERLVAPFAAGTTLLVGALTRPGGRAARPVVTRTADGWALRGVLSHVPAADRAERLLVDAADETGRVGLFLVDLRSSTVERTPHATVDRLPRWHVRLTDTPVADADVVRACGDAADVLDWTLPRIDAARCAAQLGRCDAALTLTATYVSEREQFTRPIGSFQAVAHRLADAYIDTEGLRLTTWQAIWLLAEELPAEEALAIATVWATEAPTRVGEAAMHLHGGTSVDLDYPVHRAFLGAKNDVFALGGPGQRLEELGDLLAVS
ncbi:acyl-CoA dehydrogenase family protein [Cryptosporangium minutisporangium]|uniref:Acyl-CoA dehydrogenase family protein n=1 Tax=Cryptosporangium minutisporangium TaxID=113569 RepID=A0ABP6SRU7_9ACTN